MGQSAARAKNLAARIEAIAEVIDGALGDDEGAVMWGCELRAIAKAIAPARTPAERYIAAALKEGGGYG